MKAPLGSAPYEPHGWTPLDYAHLYLMEIEETFSDQKHKYKMFLETMRDFKTKRIGFDAVVEQAKELFKGHNNLIYGFNNFLPNGIAITLDDGYGVKFEETIRFVNKIKERFQHNEHVYKSFLEIVNMYSKNNKDDTEVYNEVSTLFEDHSDLLEEITRFLPDSQAPHTAAQLLRNQAQPCDDRVSGN